MRAKAVALLLLLLLATSSSSILSSTWLRAAGLVVDMSAELEGGAEEESRVAFLLTRNLSLSFLHPSQARERSTRNPSTLPVAAPATMVELGALEVDRALGPPPPPTPPNAPTLVVGDRVAGEGEAEKVGLGYMSDTPAPGVERGRELMMGPPSS